MTLEFILLFPALMLLPVAGFTNIPYLAVLAVVLALCVPVVRLMRTQGPPFVPTPKKTVEQMMRLADVKQGERVYDLGCGDGRLLIAAAKKGAKAIGYELSVPTLLLARLRSRRHKNVSVQYADFWRKDFSDADVIFCYLLTSLMGKFQKEIWPQLKPGTRVVSHAFQMPGVEVTTRDGDGVLYVK